ncbi:hypothetical protein GOODEAATRI_010030 [Goodea atripinnis]|uniref:Uncharacterized protein n=1 Tax=Goodea atripinnis TaxID=208336 RepID=A0ABV0N037_9TELE
MECEGLVLICCTGHEGWKNMLLEIEEKVLALTELSVRSDNLLREGRTETRAEAEQLAARLRTLKGGLLELQRMLQDKQLNIQGSLQEPEDSESDSSPSSSPSVQDWLAQARTTRTQHHEDSLQRQKNRYLCVFLKELEEQLAEQKKLLQSVASRGEEILIQQASPSSARYLRDTTPIKVCFNKPTTNHRCVRSLQHNRTILTCSFV